MPNAVPPQPAPVLRQPGTDVETEAECCAAGLDLGLETLGLDEHPASTAQNARPLRTAKRRYIYGKRTRLRAEEFDATL